MHIALDARMMGAGNTRGIGRYIEEMVRAVLEVDADVHYTLVVRELSMSPFVGHPRVDHVASYIPWYSVREQVFLTKILESIGADLIHVPHWNIPLTLRAPFVATIHDLLLLQQPASAKASTRGPIVRLIKHAAFRLVLRSSLKRARLLLAPTTFVAKDIERLASVDPAKVIVTGEGISAFPEPDTSICLQKPFLFYVGSAYPHKRLDLLLEAWAEMASRYPEHELVIAGEMDAFMKKYKEQSMKSKAPTQVRFLGRVTDAQLAALYKQADLFAFPSSHEGFGLPPIEALSFGCPVVASDIPCLREVLPASGVEWFRDGDLHGMMKALETMLKDVASAKRAALSTKEWIRAHHDWKTSAKIVLKGYRASIENR
jgi:glycosyltransferase involved in cell wall biosynthesis